MGGRFYIVNMHINFFTVHIIRSGIRSDRRLLRWRDWTCLFISEFSYQLQRTEFCQSFFQLSFQFRTF